jgi:hypothetical protein
LARAWSRLVCGTVLARARNLGRRESAPFCGVAIGLSRHPFFLMHRLHVSHLLFPLGICQQTPGLDLLRAVSVTKFAQSVRSRAKPGWTGCGVARAATLQAGEEASGIGWEPRGRAWRKTKAPAPPEWGGAPESNEPPPVVSRHPGPGERGQVVRLRLKSALQHQFTRW